MNKVVRSLVAVLLCGLVLPPAGTALAAQAKAKSDTGASARDLDSRDTLLAGWKRDMAEARKKVAECAVKEKALKTEIAARRKQLAALRAGAAKSAQTAQAASATSAPAASAAVAAPRTDAGASDQQMVSWADLLRGGAQAGGMGVACALGVCAAWAGPFAALLAAEVEKEPPPSVQRNRHVGLVRQDDSSTRPKPEAEKQKAIAQTDKLAGEIEALEKQLKQTQGTREKYLSRVKLLARLGASLETQLAKAEKGQAAVASPGKSSSSDQPDAAGLSAAPRSAAKSKPPAPTPPDVREGAALEFRLPEGTPIHSVAAGEVIFADRFRGYGNLVIVEHGDGALSLYGFLSKIMARTGTPLPGGEVVGLAGFIEDSDREGFRFEMRVNKNGRDVVSDPRSWLPKGTDLRHRLLIGVD